MPCRIFVWPPFFHDSLPALVTFINPQLRMKIKLGNRSHKAQRTPAVAASRRRTGRLNGCEDGYRNAGALRAETALDPLRARSDFQLLMMDLAMPADAFSP